MEKVLDTFEIVFEIAKRAEKLGILAFDRISLQMDLDVAEEQFNLRLKALLNADDFNFAHDIVGIQNNINRETKTIENSFVPRYTGF